MTEHAERLGLRELNFQIRPDRDREVFFGKEEIANRLVDQIRRRLVLGRSIKMVVHGDLGVGKTQLLNHISYRLREWVYPVYVKCPAFHRRTTFVGGLYGIIIAELGLDRMLGLIGRVFGGLSAEPLRIQLRSSELERVIREGLMRNPKILRKYLGGGKLTPSDADALGLIQQQLSEDWAVALLEAVGDLIERTEGRKLMLLIDEFENTGVLRGDAMTMFTEAIREMCEESSRINVIFAATVRSIEENRILSNASILSRIGHLNYYEIGEYSEGELKALIEKVVEYKRLKDFDVNKAVSGIRSAVGERLNDRLFPFTSEAVDEIIESLKLMKDDGIIPALRPRETLELMDRALSVTLEEGKPVIDTQAVKAAVKRW